MYWKTAPNERITLCRTAFTARHYILIDRLPEK